MATTYEVLVQAKKLIETEARGGGYGPIAGRTAGAIYRDGDGMTVLKRSNATCFCSIGAVTGALNLDIESPLFGFSSSGTSRAQPDFAKGGKALVNAMRYLEAAAVQVLASIPPSKKARLGVSDDTVASHVMVVNDIVGRNETLAMFDLAIRNAKRRHINGKKVSK